MAIRAAFRPLVRGTTVRRGVHLVLGGVLLLPYALLGMGFVQMFADPDVPRVPAGIVLVVSVAIGVVPPFLPAMRALEIAAARALLGAELADPGAGPSWGARWRSAAWYAILLVFGGAAVLSILYAVPIAVGLVADLFGASTGRLAEVVAPFRVVGGAWVVIVVVMLLVAPVYAVAGLGALLARLAPVLLGPSPAERIAALQRQADQLVERNRLARELHDSIGHALTVMTLQAAAARRVHDTDPRFALRALEAVEETGRAAMADLDHVIGLLREVDSGPAPLRTLADLDRLVEETRAAGQAVTAEMAGDPAALPPAVSGEVYRIVQEGLTNALRHGGPGPVRVRVTAGDDGVEVELANPLPGRPHAERATGGRGIAGMRERVSVLRGRLRAGPEDGEWRVQAFLPVRPQLGEGER